VARELPLGKDRPARKPFELDPRGKSEPSFFEADLVIDGARSRRRTRMARLLTEAEQDASTNRSRADGACERKAPNMVCS
jgi:hypothetical protein